MEWFFLWIGILFFELYWIKQTQIELFYFDGVLRNAIRDMVVRGAPAIAIAAALSLAVEVANLKDFTGGSKDAASFLESKLEYLVSRFLYISPFYYPYYFWPWLDFK